MEDVVMAGLTTGRLASLAGVNTETLRYYERRGLLSDPKRRESGYRDYPVEALQVVRFIKRAQGLGFSLKEVKELLDISEKRESSCGDVKDASKHKLEEIDTKIIQLQSIRKALNRIIDRCPGKGPLSGCSILESLTKD